MFALEIIAGTLAAVVIGCTIMALFVTFLATLDDERQMGFFARLWDNLKFTGRNLRHPLHYQD